MRSRRRFWWAISLAIGPIVLSGCATRARLPEIEGLPGALARVRLEVEAGRDDDAEPGAAAELGDDIAGARVGDAVRRCDHDAMNRIEIATVGVDRAEAVRLRTLFELVRDAHLRVNRGAPHLEILIEPADTVRYAASGAKRDGILRLPQRALHIELPKAARTEWRKTYTAILADFLVQAFLPPPGK